MIQSVSYEQYETESSVEILNGDQNTRSEGVWKKL